MNEKLTRKAPQKGKRHLQDRQLVKDSDVGYGKRPNISKGVVCEY